VWCKPPVLSGTGPVTIVCRAVCGSIINLVLLMHSLTWRGVLLSAYIWLIHSLVIYWLHKYNKVVALYYRVTNICLLRFAYVWLTCCFDVGEILFSLCTCSVYGIPCYFHMESKTIRQIFVNVIRHMTVVLIDLSSLSNSMYFWWICAHSCWRSSLAPQQIEWRLTEDRC